MNKSGLREKQYHNRDIIEKNCKQHSVNSQTKWSLSKTLLGTHNTLAQPSLFKSEAIGRTLTAAGTELTLEQFKFCCPAPVAKVPILSSAGFQACTKKPRMALPDPALIVPAIAKKKEERFTKSNYISAIKGGEV